MGAIRARFRSMAERLRDFFFDRIYGPKLEEDPISLDQVLELERQALAGTVAGRDCDGGPPEAQAKPTPSDDRDLIGLAFSGGGIRSATFNLGLLQALADLRLLRSFDYLSTVSGGSYIGGWLTALIHSENGKPVQKDQPHGVCRVEQRLRTAPEQRPSEPRPDDPPASEAYREDPAIRFLRRYSNYLTPRVGLFTADTWAMISIYLRNLILNLTLLASGLAVFLLLPRLLIAGTRSFSTLQSAAGSNIAFWAGIGFTALFGALVAWLMGSNFSSLTILERPRSDDETPTPESPVTHKPSAMLWQIATLIAGAFLTSRWLPVASLPSWLDWAIWVAVIYASGWALALAAALRQPPQNLKVWRWLIATAAVAGFITGPLLPMVGDLLKKIGYWASWVWGLPLVVLWLLLLGLLQTGLMGHGHRDHQREWLSRFGGWLLILAAGWAMWFSMIIYAPVVLSVLKGWAGGAVVSGWFAATAAGLVAARGQQASKVSGVIQSLVLAIAPYIFVAGLLSMLAVSLDWGVSQLSDQAAWTEFEDQREALLEGRAIEDEIRQANEVAGRPNFERASFWQPLYQRHGELLDKTSGNWLLILVLVLGLLLITAVFSWRIDVNEFSMHGFYRNRLVRCYLGAAVDPKRRHRGKEPFTGFNESDDIRLGDLFPAGAKHQRRRGKPAPIHLINTSLNLVSGDELAWQERKAAPFILSPVACGFVPQEEGFQQESDTPIHPHGYRTTVSTESVRHYGSSPVPLTLGSAIAISGAAASPNMGFHSTPALAFLLTVFNIRIGWWLGNPRHRQAWTRSGPFFAMFQLFMELAGKTRGRGRYVYLSDGEHFENLGVYELVRRRCRFILATDVGADPEYAFDNLGNAIRKCRADLGVEIEIDAGPIKADANGLSKWHCAVGTIHYPLPGGGTELGTLLYVKSSLTGDEPADVLAYARANPPFPHQTTADQFFDESQFESYRRLGHHVAMEVLSDSVEVATERVETRAGGTRRVLKLEKLLVALSQRWYPPSAAGSESFVRHTKTLDRLFERARRTPRLAFLDAQIYPEWHRFLDGADLPEATQASQRADSLWLPESAEERRHGFYFCNSLIQLMENVYLDLNLDHDYAHPDHRGWMNLFKHWSWSGLFRATWAISAATYGHRFQAFCRRRLDLALGDISIRRLEPADAETLTADRFREAAETEGPAFLNFLEREQIETFLEYGKVMVRDVVQFELSVAGTAIGRSEAKKILRFGFGYALLGADKEVVLMRIQDHLRTMGLGREALLEMAREIGGDVLPEEAALSGDYRTALSNIAVRREAPGSDAEAPSPDAKAPSSDAEARRRFYGEFRGGERSFITLLQSVRREWQEEGGSVLMRGTPSSP